MGNHGKRFDFSGVSNENLLLAYRCLMGGGSGVAIGYLIRNGKSKKDFLGITTADVADEILSRMEKEPVQNSIEEDGSTDTKAEIIACPLEDNDDAKKPLGNCIHCGTKLIHTDGGDGFFCPEGCVL